MTKMEVAERSDEAALRKARDEIIHLVPGGFLKYEKGLPLIAYCGFDCTGREPKVDGVVNCVVCLDISGRCNV